MGTILQIVSYFAYVAAFITPEQETGSAMDPGALGIAIVVAPLVFVSIGLISRSQEVWQRVLRATAALILLSLAIGMWSRSMGAAAGFGVGVALTLNRPDFEDQLRRRLVAVVLAVAYAAGLLFLIPPAGLIAGAILPAPIVGIADEYGSWREARKRRG